MKHKENETLHTQVQTMEKFLQTVFPDRDTQNQNLEKLLDMYAEKEEDFKRNSQTLNFKLAEEQQK